MEFKINTSIPIRFEKIDSSEDDRVINVRVEVAHTEKNLNNSYFSKELLEKMGNKLAGVPIVGYIAQDSNGNTDFKGHEMKITVTEDGVDVDYLGSAFGCVLENNNARFETKVCDNGETKTYLVCDAILWRKFNTYTDIFEEDGFRWQSMELHPNSIEGYFSEDKVFHFTDAVVEALCCLGKNVNPAMLGATIEKYSFDSVQEQLKEMLDEFKESKYISIRENDTKKGVFSIYALKQETQLDINESKEDQVVPKTKQEIAEQFSLTANQLSEELYRKIMEKKFSTKNWYGEEVEVSKYYMSDYDDQFVYASDRQNGYISVKIPYSKSGDDVTFDFESASRIKWSPVDWEGNEESEEVQENFTLVILEEVKKDFDKVFSEKNELSQKMEKNADSLIELNDKFTTLEATVSEKDAKIQEQELEISGLKEFKENIARGERQANVDRLLEKFKKNLSKEEIDSFKEKESTFSAYADFEREVKLFVADKVADDVSTNSTTQSITATFTKMGLPNEDVAEKTESTSVWDRLEKNKNKI